ncbi:hypothetical protein RJT34_27962 [Clitoria ternatea]|uniref:Uncharacterized protein n=1 Tax=Clitoria ternatea TaxID=43366 RepID=A0AAN9IGL6_CLITE
MKAFSDYFTSPIVPMIDRIIGLVISMEFYDSGVAIFNRLKPPVWQNLSQLTAGARTSRQNCQLFMQYV